MGVLCPQKNNLKYSLIHLHAFSGSEKLGSSFGLTSLAMALSLVVSPPICGMLCVHCNRTHQAVELIVMWYEIQDTDCLFLGISCESLICQIKGLRNTTIFLTSYIDLIVGLSVCLLVTTDWSQNSACRTSRHPGVSSPEQIFFFYIKV